MEVKPSFEEETVEKDIPGINGDLLFLAAKVSCQELLFASLLGSRVCSGGAV